MFLKYLLPFIIGLAACDRAPVHFDFDAGQHGSGLLNDPCSTSAACAGGLACVSPAPQPNPFGVTGGGICLSDGKCPPSAPWPAHCGPGWSSPCPRYISRGVQGEGCVWDLDCSKGDCTWSADAGYNCSPTVDLKCTYFPPGPFAVPAGYCGVCL